MTTATTNRPYARRLALAGSMLGLLFALFLALSPAARAFAGDLIRQIGAITVAPGDANAPAPAPTAAPPSITDVSFATTAAEATALAGFAVLDTTWMPAGYEVSGDWSVAPQGQGVIVARAFAAEQGEGYLVLNQYRYGGDDHFEQSYGANETVAEVEVRGVPGLAITGRLMTHPARPEQAPQPSNWLMWEANGVNYTLFANSISVDNLARIAEGLQE